MRTRVVVRRGRHVGLAVVALATALVWAPAPALGHSGLGWTFTHELTDTDGLAVKSAVYRDRWVFARVSVPQIRVHYASHPTMNDQLGRSGNVRYVAGSTRLTRTSSYLSLSQSFRCCSWPSTASYRYDIRYTFYANGAFRPAVYIYGPGIEPSAVYQVFIRMDFNIAGFARDRFKVFGEKGWSTRTVEGGTRDDGAHDPAGYEWAAFDRIAGHGYYMKPRPTDGRPQVFALRYAWREGAGDLGSAVRLPTSYDNDQSIVDHNVVEWYWSLTRYRRPSGCPRTCNAPVPAGPLIYRVLDPTPTPTPTLTVSPVPSPSPSPS